MTIASRSLTIWAAAHAARGSGVARIVAFGLGFWQNHALLDVLNRPLERPPPEP
jgi:hypothetical protein